jgi:hypothetical protein
VLRKLAALSTAFHFAIRMVKKPEESGQELLFDPRGETLA